MKANLVETKYTHFLFNFNDGTFLKKIGENHENTLSKDMNITHINSYHNNGSLNQVIHSFKSSNFENNNSLHFVNSGNNNLFSESSNLSGSSKVKVIYNVEPSNTEKLKNRFKSNKTVEIDYSKFN